MRHALARAVVAVLRHTGHPGNLGLGSEQAPVSARWGRVRERFPCAGECPVSAAGHAHPPRTHGLAWPPGGSASDRCRSRAGHGRGAFRCPCPEASPGPSRGRPRSRSFARQGCCAQQGSLSANRIGGARKHRDRPKQKSAWLRRERCFDRDSAVSCSCSSPRFGQARPPLPLVAPSSILPTAQTLRCPRCTRGRNYGCANARAWGHWASLGAVR